MSEMPGMIRPELQALPQIRDRMTFQFAGQAIFVGLGKAKNAVFFSIFRKVIIVIPLIIILPSMFHIPDRTFWLCGTFRIRKRTLYA